MKGMAIMCKKMLFGLVAMLLLGMTLAIEAEAYNLKQLQDNLASGGQFGCPKCDLSRSYPAIKPGTNWQGANLTLCGFSDRNLSRVNFRGATLTRIQIYDCNMSGAILTGANLTSARIVRTNLTGADLTGAKIGGTVLQGSNLSGATWVDGSKCAQGSKGTCIKAKK